VTEFAADQWWSETESPKAWMSVRDADLLEELLHRVAARLAGTELRVVEWGAGRSTLWYTSFLDTLGVPYRWLAVEHNGAFFDEFVAGRLRERPGAAVASGTSVPVAELGGLLAEHRVLAVTYDAGDLRPFLPGREADRHADLDDYVALPGRLGFAPHVAIVDGRKRRRCVTEAAGLLGPDGQVVLHDAWRRHYQCAWSHYRSGRRFGDEWWIGAHRETDFTDLLAWHAFERNKESGDPIGGSDGGPEPAGLVAGGAARPLPG
jgi:hypothetical protein